jgi:hypothetical protein
MKSGKATTNIALSLAAIVLIFGYQNCGEFYLDALKVGQFGSLGAARSAGGVLVPSTDKIDANCLTSTAYDACIIKQNPVAASNSPLSANATTRRSQLASQAIYGVKLTSLSGNGRLENDVLSVQSINSNGAMNTSPINLKSTPAATDSSAFEQVNAYYWMNRAAEYFDARTKGALPAKGKKIRVIVDDTITGYETESNTIRLKKTEASGAVAWNGDVSIHIFGVANLMLANPNGWRTLSATTHRTCNAIDKGCCTAAAGCANAIRFGVGEYFAASMFPDRTRIGEGIANTGNPQSIGGVARNVAALSSTAAQVFSTASGHAHALGLVYASVWWKVRETAGSAASAEIDRIFLEHLSLLDGTDTFRTAISKAKSVDARLYNGRHSGKFDTELTARGL